MVRHDDKMIDLQLRIPLRQGSDLLLNDLTRAGEANVIGGRFVNRPYGHAGEKAAFFVRADRDEIDPRGTVIVFRQTDGLPFRLYDFASPHLAGALCDAPGVRLPGLAGNLMRVGRSV